MKVLQTSVAGLVLAPLKDRHATALHALVQANRDHLTAYGDYADLVATPLNAMAVELAKTTSQGLRFGIFLDRSLVGRMDLIPVDPPRYGTGYWLAQSATGKGYATAALNSLLDHARDTLQASEIFAGVTHGNLPSVALLERAGFVAIEHFETYTRFHRTLTR